MALPTPNQKRKRDIPSISSTLLHPGSWRGKRSRSSSPPGSSPGSGTSPRVSGPDKASQSTKTPNMSSPVNALEPLAPYPSSQCVACEIGTGSSTIARDPLASTVQPTSSREHNETTWIKLERALAALHISTKICPPLHSAVDGLRSCIYIFESEKEAARPRKDYEELAAGLAAMVNLLIKHMIAPASREIVETITDIAENIKREIESIDLRHSRNGPSRLMRASGDEEDLVRRYHRIEHLFRQLQAEASMSAWSDAKRHFVNTQLENLGPVKMACFNSRLSMDIGRRSCTKNTRTQILEGSMAWAEDPNGKKIYWMNGMAGTGKTTIAYSLCERLEAAGQLAGSFFCTRTSLECSEAKRIAPTIAYQLARRMTTFRDALCRILDRDPDAGTLNTASQFDSLLANPLLEARETIAKNLVVVVDALDECNDPHVVKVVLDTLFRYAADLPVKFFITSRPEPAIRSSMMSGSSECDRLRSVLYLHEIEKSLVKAEIELYLMDELKHMLPAHRADISELAEQAGNLFIYAATAVRYIQPTGMTGNSKQRLKSILAVSSGSKRSMSDIDVLYSAILSAAICDNRLEQGEQDSIRTILWTSICVCEPVLIDTLAALSGFDDAELAEYALQPLRSVLHVSEHNNLVTTLHASFPDFMFSKERSQEFFCDRPHHDQFLAKRCLQIMKAQLRFNICQIESSFIPDDEIHDLENRAETHISQELFYASRFWVEHLTQGMGSITSSFDEAINEFLSKRLLFWMEVMNLKKCMVTCAVAATKVHMWLRNSCASPDLVFLARDAQIFIGKYTTHPVSASTPHINISSLPLSSPTNLIRSRYQPRFTGLIEAMGSFMEQVDQASLDVWSSSYPILSASFSIDRKYIVIGDSAGRLSIRNPHNGEPVIEFQAHHNVVSSVAFSEDGRLIVSSSYDCTLCIWSVGNGSLVSGPFKGHSGQINSAKFSPDGMRLVSGSEDCTIRTWTIHGSSHSQLLLNFSPVKSVVFSPTGLQLASGSNDNNVRIWDALKGVLLYNLQGHTRWVACVQYSPCGNFVVSGSNDCTIRVWNALNGTPIGGSFRGHLERITSIVVSPEGERIVSGSLDRTIRVWHRNSGELISGPFEGHTLSVESVQFSPDGARIISASEDATIRIWNTLGKTLPIHTQNPPETGWKINLIAISFDGAYIASLHADGTVRIWNMRNYKRLTNTIVMRDEKVLQLAFSLDSAYTFLAYADGVLYMLDTQTGHRPIYGGFFADGSSDRISHQPVALSPDGRNAVSATPRSPNVLSLWDVSNNRLVCAIVATGQWLHPASWFEEAAFSANGTRLATGTNGGAIDVWDGHSGQHIAGPFNPGVAAPIQSMGISPDGTHIVSRREGEGTLIYNVAEGTHTAISGPMDDEERIQVNFSPDGAHVACLRIGSRPDQLIITLYSTRDPGGGVSNTVQIPPGFVPLEVPGFISNESYLVALDAGECELFAYHFHVGCRDPTYMLSPDGWLLDESSQKVVWVPPEIRREFPKTSQLRLAERLGASIKVGYHNLLIGADWGKCYIGE